MLISVSFIRLGKLELFILLSCDQLTSNTRTAASFIQYSPALENSIIEIHLVDWNDLFPEASEPLQSWSDQQTCGSFPLRHNDRRMAQSDRSTPRLPVERSQGRWRHFLSLQASSDAGCGRTRNQYGLTNDVGVRAAWKTRWLNDKSNFLRK